jgi:uncharacterized membrane protein YhaH (DUF805 family)
MIPLVLKNAFHYSGSSTRLGYFLYGVIFAWLLISFVLLLALPYGHLSSGISLGAEGGKQALLGLIAIVPFSLAAAWVTLIQTIKRLRDLGHSGWWLLLVLFLGPLPYIGIVVGLGFYAYLLFYKGKGVNNPLSVEWKLIVGSLLVSAAVIAIEVSLSRPTTLETDGIKPSDIESAPIPNVAAPATQSIISSSKALDDETLTKIVGKPLMILTKEIATGFRDLDGDGVEDVFLTDASMECGNGGCTYRLIVSNNGAPKNIGEIEAKTIEALSATSNGLRDLKTVWQSGCVSNLVNVMKFDGVKYNLVKSYEEPGSCASEQSNKVISNGSTNVAPQPISSSNPRQLNQQPIVQIRNGQYKEAVMLLQEAAL